MSLTGDREHIPIEKSSQNVQSMGREEGVILDVIGCTM